MCCRFFPFKPTSDLVERLAVDEVAVEDVPLYQNVAPSQSVLAVATSRDV